MHPEYVFPHSPDRSIAVDKLVREQPDEEEEEEDEGNDDDDDDDDDDMEDDGYSE